MMPRVRGPLALLLVVLLGCAAPPRPHGRLRPRANPWPAITALELGDFEAAWRRADAALAIEGRNAQARVVRAVCKAMDGYAHLLASVDRPEALAMAPATVVRAELERIDQRLTWADLDLAAAEWDVAFALEICPACWSTLPRWAGLLEVQSDPAGHPLPATDPRRRPTVRFDASDIRWARGAIASQRAALNLLLARDPEQAAARLATAKRLLREATAHAERVRALVGAETDDDREWIPGPRQRPLGTPPPILARLGRSLDEARAPGTTSERLLLQVLWFP